MFKFLKEIMIDAIERVAPFVDAKANLPVLEMVLFTFTEGGAQLRATSFKGTGTYARTTVKGLNDGVSGSIALPYRDIVQWLKLAEGKDVTMFVDWEAMVATLKTDKAIINVKGIGGDEYPPMPNPEEAQMFQMDGAQFLTALRAVAPTVANDDGRLVLTHVHITPGGEWAGVNGYALSVITPFTNRLGDEALIPLDTLKAFASSTKNDCDVMMSSYHLVNDRVEVVILNPFTGRFPDYSQIINTEEDIIAEAEVSRAELAKAFARAKVFAKDQAFFSRVEISEGEVRVTSKSAKFGESDAAVSAFTSGEGVIGVNMVYISDILAAVASDSVVIKMTKSMLLVGAGSANYAIMQMAVR